METLRIALIGKTGAGKSAVGNTLLGQKIFESKPAAESVTVFCEKQEGKLPSGRIIRVVDTPGIMDTSKRDVRTEIAKAIAALSPGPHAFLIVLQPGRATDEERQVIKEMRGLFGDESFLDHTIIVMTRKGDMTDKDDKPMDIHDFISRMAARDVQDLYEQCGKRIVAVENKHSTEEQKQQYAQEIGEEIVRMGGYYSHAYFKLLIKKRIQEQDTELLKVEIEKLASELNRNFCTIL